MFYTIFSWAIFWLFWFFTVLLYSFHFWAKQTCFKQVSPEAAKWKQTKWNLSQMDSCRSLLPGTESFPICSVTNTGRSGGLSQFTQVWNRAVPGQEAEINTQISSWPVGILLCYPEPHFSQPNGVWVRGNMPAFFSLFHSSIWTPQQPFSLLWRNSQRKCRWLLPPKIPQFFKWLQILGLSDMCQGKKKKNESGHTWGVPFSNFSLSLSFKNCTVLIIIILNNFFTIWHYLK